MSDDRFLRTAQLVGNDALDKLKHSYVAVFGIGGVGSYALEALVRSGVGAFDIFDSDNIDITNINRQIIALESTVGRPKVEVALERMLDINPNIKANANKLFITPELIEQMDFSKYNYVIDAVDNVTAKIAICTKARNQNIPVISAMGAGNKLDPTCFEVAMIEKTSVCPLARVMRTELKKRGITGVKAVYSKEPAKTVGEVDGNRRSPTPKSIAYVPSVAGLILAGEVISDIMKG